MISFGVCRLRAFERTDNDVRTAQVDAVELPLSAAQEAIWFAHQMDSSGQLYNCGEYIAIDGPLDLATFRSAWALCGAENDAMRVRTVMMRAGATPERTA